MSTKGSEAKQEAEVRREDRERDRDKSKGQKEGWRLEGEGVGSGRIPTQSNEVNRLNFIYCGAEG